MVNVSFCMSEVGATAGPQRKGGIRQAGDWVAKIDIWVLHCLCKWSPMKILDTKTQVSFPGWQYFAYVVIQIGWKKEAPSMQFQ